MLTDDDRHPPRLRHDVQVRPLRRHHPSRPLGQGQEAGSEPPRGGTFVPTPIVDACVGRDSEKPNQAYASRSGLTDEQIRKILVTQQGEDSVDLRESILYGWV